MDDLAVLPNKAIDALRPISSRFLSMGIDIKRVLHAREEGLALLKTNLPPHVATMG
ncbi:MAG: hypothetical protein P8Z73_11190 [Desulfobacteraceae bacterium]|jgi:hypothetical protein